MTDATPSAVLAAVEALATSSFSSAKFTRGGAKPSSLSPGGNVAMRDGDPGDPEMTLSPRLYTFNHRVIFDVATYPGADPRQALTVMLAPFAAAIEADPFLGGLADWMELDIPSPDDTDTLGAPVLNWAEVGLVVTYTTSNPWG